MKSYKCPQCNLTNWTTVEFCKRCQTPNQYFDQTASAAVFGGATAANFSSAASFANVSAPDYSSPPPPNVFGSNVGTTATIESFNEPQNTYANRPKPSPN